MASWSSDLSHFLDSLGSLVGRPGSTPYFLASVVAVATSRPGIGWAETDIECHLRHGRRRCRGCVEARCSEVTGRVEWRCRGCGAEGSIQGWETTAWDRRPATAPSRAPGQLGRRAFVRPRNPHIATLDEVRISKQDDAAVIEYLDPSVGATHFRIGPEVAHMSNAQILDRFNETLRAQQRGVAQHPHVPVEIPPGRPQIRWFARGQQWVPRGDVLRCIIEEEQNSPRPVICIDEHELSPEEFGAMLSTYVGWGMRITFVPEEDLETAPAAIVREPDESDA